MRTYHYLSLATIGLIASTVLAVPAFAETTQHPGSPEVGNRQEMGQRAPGIFGTVTAINGTTLTVTQKAQPKGGSETVYTVNASGATVTKNAASASFSDIAVNDTVIITGTVNGTSVTATAIRDGVMNRGDGKGTGMGSTTPSIIQGNGQPVVGGTVTAINGSSLTVTNKSDVTYTVNVSDATIEKANKVGSLSDIAVGDNVVIQGTVNGTSITASSVIDSGTKSTAEAGNGETKQSGGFWSGIGGFFKRLFGFF